MVMYFLGHLIASTMTTCLAIVMKISGKVYAHVSNLFMCEKSNFYVTK